MGTVIKELVQRGHDMAAELNASCGAVDVRSVAKLISDLASQLDVQLVRGNQIQQQLAAVVAENAGLKKFPDQIINFIGKLGTSEIGSDTKERIELAASRVKTPATDSILRAAEARGATAAGDYLKLNAQHMSDDERLRMQDAAEICYGTAAKLREGKA